VIATRVVKEVSPKSSTKLLVLAPMALMSTVAAPPAGASPPLLTQGKKRGDAGAKLPVLPRGRDAEEGGVQAEWLKSFSGGK